VSSTNEVSELPSPVTVAGQRVGVNDAIAAALTRIIGSMPALYAVLVFVGAWIVLGTWGPLHSSDPYPFAFLLFLNNVVQLVLCSVILVGQRVLGLAADRRAVQTYENAEAIFARVADLQAHLDRHDRALSRGVSLLESSAHPWIEKHRVQTPPQAVDHAVGTNGRIAAWLTQRLGSMWAFYLAAGTQVVWIGLAVAGAQSIDPYPFAFMTFLSTFAQLIFMIVIMVGQDVLGHAADRRSEQTFQDAEAILHECRRMKARLTAQDRIIDSLVDYAAAQVSEQLAQAIYHSGSAGRDGQPWHQSPHPVKHALRGQARRVGEQLATIGCLMVPAVDPDPGFTVTDDEIQRLAELEYAHASSESGPADEAVPWDQLPEQVKKEKRQHAARIPALLASVGFQVLRQGAAGVGEAHFTPAEWATLQQALMASGVLVSLAEGVVDAEEVFALIKALREASISHPSAFIRQLTAACTFDTGLAEGTHYGDYQGPALAAIRDATAIIARVAAAELDPFATLLIDLATVVADANNEGGFFGLGARPRTPREASAIQAISQATHFDMSGAQHAGPVLVAG
jgi:uncharacterized membrane protein